MAAVASSRRPKPCCCVAALVFAPVSLSSAPVDLSNAPLCPPWREHDHGAVDPALRSKSSRKWMIPLNRPLSPRFVRRRACYNRRHSSAGNRAGPLWKVPCLSRLRIALRYHSWILHGCDVMSSALTLALVLVLRCNYFLFTNRSIARLSSPL